MLHDAVRKLPQAIGIKDLTGLDRIGTNGTDRNENDPSGL